MFSDYGSPPSRGRKRIVPCHESWRKVHKSACGEDNRESLRSRPCRRQRIVVKDGRQPLLGLLDAPAFALGVVFDLIALDLADAEIVALRVAEIEAAHGSAGPHRETLGQLDADAALDVEQAEQRLLLSVVGLRRIARRRSDAAILLGNELDVAQL